MMAANSIRAGEYKAIVAGGMESMTNAPQLLMGQRTGAKMGNSTLVDSMIHDGLWDVYNDVHMGNTGETIAKECSISREQSDAFAARSHHRAAHLAILLHHPSRAAEAVHRPAAWHGLCSSRR